MPATSTGSCSTRRTASATWPSWATHRTPSRTRTTASRVPLRRHPLHHQPEREFAAGGVGLELGLINGTPAFLVGAPGAGDAANAQNGAGRAYLIYGGNNLNNVPNTTVDLDTIAGGTSGLSVVTFTTTIAGGQTGRAVAGVGDVTGDGILDIAIGAPTAAFPGSGLRHRWARLPRLRGRDPGGHRDDRPADGRPGGPRRRPASSSSASGPAAWPASRSQGRQCRGPGGGR